MGERTNRIRYAAMGAALSLGAPAGLVVVRAMGSPGLSWTGLVDDARGDALTYAYVTLSTFLVFSLFGYALGRHSDGLAEESHTDPLTGLWNTRYLRARLQDEFAFHRRYATPLSLLLVDLDRLKAINDAAGHSAGDRALARVAAALREGMRSTDVAARCGGDEFVLLAPRTDASAAARIAERIRAAVAKGGEGNGPSATVSIGALTLANGAAVVELTELLRSADQALYEAKRQGRDRVVQVVKGEGK